MDFKKALLILELQEKYDDRMLKKKYVEKCLKYHPDKNNNATPGKFLEIKEAYEYLKQKKNVETINDFESTYREKNSASSFQNLVSSLYTLVTDNYQNVSIKLFEKLEKNKSIQLYEFIVKYNYIFKVSNEVLKEMENLVREKVKNDNLIILDVSLCDITSKNIFVLKLTEDKVHYIPLWHNEMTIDQEIRIKCIRELPSHIHIDEQNNIHFYDKKEVSKLLNREKIEFTIGELMFSLYVSDLKVKKYQKIELKSCGIPRINKQDLYDISKLGHVYYYLELC